MPARFRWGRRRFAYRLDRQDIGWLDPCPGQFCSERLQFGGIHKNQIGRAKALQVGFEFLAGGDCLEEFVGGAVQHRCRFQFCLEPLAGPGAQGNFQPERQGARQAFFQQRQQLSKFQSFGHRRFDALQGEQPFFFWQSFGPLADLRFDDQILRRMRQANSPLFRNGEGLRQRLSIIDLLQPIREMVGTGIFHEQKAIPNHCIPQYLWLERLAILAGSEIRVSGRFFAR